MHFAYVQICATFRNNRVNERALEPMITQEAQERQVINASRLSEAFSFERSRTLCFFYASRSQIPGLGPVVLNLELPPLTLR